MSRFSQIQSRAKRENEAIETLKGGIKVICKITIKGAIKFYIIKPNVNGREQLPKEKAKFILNNEAEQ